MNDDLKTNYTKLNAKYQKLLQENKELKEWQDKLKNNCHYQVLEKQANRIRELEIKLSTYQCNQIDNINFMENARRTIVKLEKQLKELPKNICDEIKRQFYYEFEELIPSVMADKIDAIQSKYEKETKSE